MSTLCLMHPDFQEWLDTPLQGPASTDNVLADLRALMGRLSYDQLHLANPAQALEITDSQELLFPGGFRFSLDHQNGQCLDLSGKMIALAKRKFGKSSSFFLLPFTGHDAEYFFSPNSKHVFLMFCPNGEYDAQTAWVIDPSLKQLKPYVNSGYSTSRLIPEELTRGGSTDFKIKAPGCTPLAMTKGGTLLFFGMSSVNNTFFVHQNPNEMPIGFRSAAQLANLDFMQGESTILEAARRLEEKVRSALRP